MARIWPFMLSYKMDLSSCEIVPGLTNPVTYWHTSHTVTQYLTGAGKLIAFNDKLRNTPTGC